MQPTKPFGQSQKNMATAHKNQPLRTKTSYKNLYEKLLAQNGNKEQKAAGKMFQAKLVNKKDRSARLKSQIHKEKKHRRYGSISKERFTLHSKRSKSLGELLQKNELLCVKKYLLLIEKTYNEKEWLMEKINSHSKNFKSEKKIKIDKKRMKRVQSMDLGIFQPDKQKRQDFETSIVRKNQISTTKKKVNEWKSKQRIETHRKIIPPEANNKKKDKTNSSETIKLRKQKASINSIGHSTGQSNSSKFNPNFTFKGTPIHTDTLKKRQKMKDLKQEAKTKNSDSNKKKPNNDFSPKYMAQTGNKERDLINNLFTREAPKYHQDKDFEESLMELYQNSSLLDRTDSNALTDHLITFDLGSGTTLSNNNGVKSNGNPVLWIRI